MIELGLTRSQIPEQFHGVVHPVVKVEGEVVSVMSFIMGNYYHFLTEMVPRYG